MEASCLAGNPDIRVHETVKTDDGLHAAHVVAGKDAGREKEEEKGRPEETGGHLTTEEPRESAVQNLAETGEVPERRELRHVPGGTWLNQVVNIALTTKLLRVEKEIGICIARLMNSHMLATLFL
ncbi:hypothetical protein NDU88_001237 [Pleurodeles waltl]|uniref:Uncharacterized protein n=1 Tax=Pleurodeles waltl TaxID=8319 RepID=A0AAV7SZP5_PLEWA|nr:hypothetical protein NDU88_001237 [Pleurodeles waltl]